MPGVSASTSDYLQVLCENDKLVVSLYQCSIFSIVVIIFLLNRRHFKKRLLTSLPLYCLKRDEAHMVKYIYDFITPLAKKATAFIKTTTFKGRRWSNKLAALMG